VKAVVLTEVGKCVLSVFHAR